ncbi:hypothetical protein AB833_04060 [Chromatiales bacterium (ex Bugula neritina AB1)]|nr:hypothetical protein AB833_04060 [Chromatiales bacterium (ex Bugula neritina AB1)]
MSPTAKQVQTLSATELADAPAAELMQLQAEARRELRRAKVFKDWVDGAIAQKYAQRAQVLRQQLGKDTGLVRFEDQGIAVACDLTKKPIWDQARLAELARRIRANGDNPADFIDISYRVAERKYSAWPTHLQAAFKPARTLKTGKPTFELNPVQEQQA